MGLLDDLFDDRTNEQKDMDSANARGARDARSDDTWDREVHGIFDTLTCMVPGTREHEAEEAGRHNTYSQTSPASHRSSSYGSDSSYSGGGGYSDSSSSSSSSRSRKSRPADSGLEPTGFAPIGFIVAVIGLSMVATAIFKKESNPNPPRAQVYYSPPVTYVYDDPSSQKIKVNQKPRPAPSKNPRIKTTSKSVDPWANTDVNTASQTKDLWGNASVPNATVPKASVPKTYLNKPVNEYFSFEEQRLRAEISEYESLVKKHIGVEDSQSLIDLERNLIAQRTNELKRLLEAKNSPDLRNSFLRDEKSRIERSIDSCEELNFKLKKEGFKEIFNEQLRVSRERLEVLLRSE